ncbi:MAG TPA: restriction endonuclease subunit S [Mammaliicoccus lentus]|nr:restriction endonuclease subunit S [Mammaliicoccus lentus]HJF20821.1 restriction endonuclease subunit S [Mammaliicoccus lentus]
MFDWAQRKLGDYITVNKIKNKENNHFIPYSISNKWGFIPQEKQFGEGNTYSKTNKATNYIVEPNTFAYNPARINVGSIAYQNNQFPVIVSSLYEIFKAKKNLNDEFLMNWFKTEKFTRQIQKLQEGGVRQYFFIDKMQESRITIPFISEQEEISKTLNQISNLIKLQQRKTEQLKLLKKAMLQKGFTNKSAPTLRFKGFSKAWTEYPLGNLGKACSGYGFPNSEQGGNKGIPFYKVSDMNLAGNEDEMIYANNYVTDAQIDRNNWKPIVDVPAIFFAKVGAAVLLNRKRLCKRPFLLDNNTMAYSLNKNILSTQFTKSLFETINLPSFIQVGALPSYNTNDIESIKVKIPKIDEQEKIGILLKKIERLITRQQSKIKKLHSTKQFLLQNMFI